MFHKAEVTIGGRVLRLETGKYAKQANGAVFAMYGETAVLATATSGYKPREGADFLPLVVDYVEKAYAAGKIPGGFIKREGRPREKETLTSRLIDRPIRPLFPENYFYETQIIALVLSADIENDPDVIALNAASSALTVSDIPFMGPIGAVRIGRIGDEFVVNPTLSEMGESRLNLVCAGTKDAIVMVEAGADMVQESILVEALELAREPIGQIIEAQLELQRAVGKPKRDHHPELFELPHDLIDRIEGLVGSRLSERVRIPAKLERQFALDELLEELHKQFADEDERFQWWLKRGFEELQKRYVRRMILDEQVRVDGRGLDEIRPITCEVGILPRTHGSATFTRGETQALVILTLGTSVDEQKIDGLEGESFKRFMLHYNFPPFSVGETAMLRGPGRREVGHGALAEKALLPVIPEETSFPYTLRIVSDILESNGSTSMATVCGGTLSLMDAGVPISDAVSGIAMGLVAEGDKFYVLSDILGIEDHLGDMDFKVAGTREGVTALQLDIKTRSVSTEVLRKALEQARAGRLFILEKMLDAIPRPRETLSIYAPRIISMMINKDKIRDLIGPGGKTIRGIIEKTGVKIDVDDSGEVKIASSSDAASQEAVKMIEELTAEPEQGKVYIGKVKRIESYGAFVEIMPGVEGLLHISQIADQRISDVRDIMKEGDQVTVMVMSSDDKGRLRLSRKAALRRHAKDNDKRPHHSQSHGSSHHRGDHRRSDRDKPGWKE